MKTLSLNFIFILFFSFSLFSQSPPQGTVRLKSSQAGIKYIDVNEITIQSWREFLYWTLQEYGRESAEYKALLPDSTIIQKIMPNWNHPSFSYYPIVGISYKQAMEYCAWRSLRINEYLKSKKKKYTISFSLPAKTDFEDAYKQQKYKTSQKKLTPIEYNNKKLVNIADNAHEITSDSTVLERDLSGKLQFQPYQGPSAIMGFRCVAKVVKIK